MCNVGQAGRTYNVADINDSMQVYTQEVKRELCFMVISKREFRLYVYEARPEQYDTILAAHFPGAWWSGAKRRAFTTSVWAPCT